MTSNPSPAPPVIEIMAVCTGAAQPLHVGARRVLSAIRKSPAPGPVHAARLGLQGDEQVDLNHHGGLEKAVYAYPAEHLPRWRQALTQAGMQAHAQANAQTSLQMGEPAVAPKAEEDFWPPPGFMGENLRIRGLTEAHAWVGDTLHFQASSCVLRITAPRLPCDKLNAIMGFAHAARLMAQEAICGFYLAVETPGLLAPGMTARLHPGARSLSIAQAMRGKWAKYQRD